MNRFFIALSALVLLSGCVTTYQPQLTPEERESINSIEAITIVPQEEIDVQFVPSMAGSSAGAAYGIVGALVGSAIDASINDTRSKEAEVNAKPYRDLLLGYDASAIVKATIESQLSGLESISEVVVTSDRQMEDLEPKEYQGLGKDGVLFVNSSYALSPQQDVLFVKAFINLYQRFDQSEAEKSKKNKLIAGWMLQYQSPSRAISLDVSEEGDQGTAYQAVIAPAPLWTKEDLISEIERGAKHVGHLVKVTLDDTRTAEDYAAMVGEIPVGGAQGQGYPLGEFDGNKIYRVATGALYSVPAGEGLIVNMIMAQ